MNFDDDTEKEILVGVGIDFLSYHVIDNIGTSNLYLVSILDSSRYPDYRYDDDFKLSPNIIDFDADGDLDVIVNGKYRLRDIAEFHWPSNMILSENIGKVNGKISFSIRELYKTDLRRYFFGGKVLDFDRDRDFDIVLNEKGIDSSVSSIFWLRNDGRYRFKKIFMLTNIPYYLQDVKDFDRDSDQDLLIFDRQFLKLLLNKGKNVDYVQRDLNIQNMLLASLSTYLELSGTSMAAPHVAGIVALIKQAHPHLSPEKIKKLLKATAKNLGYGTNTQGAGRVDALRAVKPFDDVPLNYWAGKEIVNSFLEGITSGCRYDATTNQRWYCPADALKRDQIALFLTRAMNQEPFNNPTPTFADVPTTHPQYGFIEKIYQLGITTGCRYDAATGKLYYCPADDLTRAYMAIFLSRAANISSYDNPTPTFADVPKTHFAYKEIEGIYRAGITTGCRYDAATGKRYYCPNNAVRRDEIAVFLVRAFQF